VKSYLPHTWFDARLAVGPSRVHGHGIYATSPIAQAEIVMVWGGTPYTRSDLDSGTVPPGTSYSVIAEDVVLAGPEDGMDYYLNHSCEPNLWMGDEVTLVARFDIASGEELLIDYAMVESEADYVLDACRCDSDHCRVVITGQDWRQPTLQERYQYRFLPFINERIAQRGGTGRPPA
jgi:uncharacterized protein